MRATLARWLEAIRTGFWFLPTVMLACAAALALGLLHLDGVVDPGLKNSLHWAYSGGPEGARSLLSTIAGSMITAASVTFSLASVALSIASQQYGSRVLRNFMRDRITQVLLGTFVATFIYSVLVVRSIRGSDIGSGFVPAISVTVAIGLSLASLVLLVYFIHHISSSIQASRIIRVIAEDLEKAIPKLYPSEAGTPRRSTAPPPQREGSTSLVQLDRSGYLQTVDLKTLLEIATAADSLFEVDVQPGDHLLEGATLLRATGPRPLTGDEATRVHKAFYLDRERTPSQDIRYHFQQLTDVVVRALSPGINDPFTAINGIDELTVAMRHFVRHDRVSTERKDKRGVLRLIARSPGVAELLEKTVGHIAIYASSDAFVMSSLRRVLDGTVPLLEEPEAMAKVGELRARLDHLQQVKAASA